MYKVPFPALLGTRFIKSVEEEYLVVKRGREYHCCEKEYDVEKGKQYHLPYNIKAVWKEYQEGKGTEILGKKIKNLKKRLGRISSCRNFIYPCWINKVTSDSDASKKKQKKWLDL